MTNTPDLPPPEPLDEAERSLARALRNLPAGSPPPELDALVLGAARRAVQIPPARRDRRWIIGLGSAASALLAMGVLLKMHGLGRDAVLVPPASEEAPSAELRKTAAPPATTPMEAAKDAAPASAAGGPAPAAAPVAADMNTAAAPARGEPEQLKSPPPAELQPPPPLKEISPHAFPSSEAANKPKAIAPPAPPPPVVSSTPTLMSTPAPAAPAAAAAATMDERKQAAAAEADTAARRDAQTRQSSNAVADYGALSGVPQEQAAKKTAPAGAMQSNEPIPQRSLDKLEVGGARLKAAAPALPPPADDVKLDADDWIARIRARLDNGDRAGATASLKAFVHAHPDAAIPDDLRPLLH